MKLQEAHKEMKVMLFHHSNYSDAPTCTVAEDFTVKLKKLSGVATSNHAAEGNLLPYYPKHSRRSRTGAVALMEEGSL